jgi:hypothetical protein
VASQDRHRSFQLIRHILLNLYLGFRGGEMIWTSGHGVRDGTITYSEHKLAFVYLGFMSTGMGFFGLTGLRTVAQDIWNEWKN